MMVLQRKFRTPIKKPLVGLNIFGLIAGLALSGCGKPKTDSIILRYSVWGGADETKIFQSIEEDFGKAHPGVKVQMERIPFGDYMTKLLTQFSAGSPPDVMWVNCNQLASFASRKMFLDLKPFVDKDPSLKLTDFYPEAINFYTVDGELTAIPSNIAPLAVVYYNKKEFDAAGVPYPKDDWTYEEFLETAKKLTRKDAKGDVTQFGFVDEWVMWDTWILAFGGQLVDNEKHPTRCVIDSPEAIAGMQFRADLLFKYGVTPSPAQVTAMGNLGNSDLFMNGKAAMFHTGIWHVPTFRQVKGLDWDVVEFPKGPNGHRAFAMDAAGYGILKTSKHPELAYELVKYLAGEVGEKVVAATGLAMPALQSVAKSPVFLDDQAPKSKAFLTDSVKDGHFASFDPKMQEWTDMVGTYLDRIFTGAETPEFALKKAAQEVNKKFFGKP